MGIIIMKNKTRHINLSDTDFKDHAIHGVGIDVHKHSITVAVAEKRFESINIVKIQSFSTNDIGYSDFWSFVMKYRPQTFVFEASGVYSIYFHEFLEHQNICSNLNAKIIRLNPRVGKQMHFASTNHDDPVDARSLAYIAVMGITRSLKESKASIYKTSKELTRAYTQYGQEKTRIKDRIKRILDHSGIYPRDLDLNSLWGVLFIEALSRNKGTVKDAIECVLKDEQVPKRSKKALEKRLYLWSKYQERSLKSEYQKLLEILVIRLEILNSCVITIEKLMNELIISNLDLQELLSILSPVPGIGLHGALSIISEINEIDRFENYKSFLNYAGLSPTLHSSGESSRTGRINRRSNKFLRSVFYKAGVSISSKVKNDSDLKEYSRRIQSRYRKGKIVYIKTAAKTARIVFALLKKRESYKPFYERSSISDKNLNKSKTREILHKKKSIEKMAKRIMKKKEYLSDELIRQIKSTFEVE